MEFASNLLNSLRGKVAPAGFNSDSGAVAWPELHARFTAAHALAGEMARGSHGIAAPAGGFVNWKSAKTADGNASRPVNRSALADEKGAGCIGDDIAEQPIDGGRGQ